MKKKYVELSYDEVYWICHMIVMHTDTLEGLISPLREINRLLISKLPMEKDGQNHSTPPLKVPKEHSSSLKRGIGKPVE